MSGRPCGQAVAAVVSLCFAGCGDSGSFPRLDLGAGAGGVAFVEDSTCLECHQQQAELWTGSHHDWAMKPASPETVLGDFGGAEFVSGGKTAKFFQDEGRYFVRTDGPDGELADFPVSYTFGVEPLQQYLIAFPGGRLQCLPIAWDTEQKRWFDLYPDEEFEPDDPLHWTGLYQTWNHMCAECHSTNLRKEYDAEADAYRTVWSAMNVGCQSCHGPGAAHAEWAENRPPEEKGEGNYGLQLAYPNTDSQVEVGACARCHSRRHQVSEQDLHGRPFSDDFLVETLREDLYHADGQIREEVYVYGSFLQSKMYHAGVRCTDCHDPHSAKLLRSGNGVCTGCHQTSPPLEYPDLPSKEYETAEHHFHSGPNEGSLCVDCHMPAKNYMVVDPRRDHSFRVPRPDLSVKIGTPNACTGCHGDQPAEWAAAAVEKWYPRSQHRGPHFAETIAQARTGARDAETPLVELAQDAEQPAIVRATALDLLRGYGPRSLAAMLALLADKDALVRARAVAGLDRLEPEGRLRAVVPLLSDPIRAVRIEAARVLSSLPVAMLGDNTEAFKGALAEFRAAQHQLLDTPGARLNLAVLASHQGEPHQAEAHYTAALEMDPYFLPAALNLSTLHAQQGEPGKAEAVLRGALARAPENGELHYSLGLIQAEQGQVGESAKSLARAAELIPGRARIRYNYSLALQQLGQMSEAEAALRQAGDLDPEDPDIAYALAVFYLQRGQPAGALSYAERLVKLLPNEPGARQLVQRIQAQMGGGR